MNQTGSLLVLLFVFVSISYGGDLGLKARAVKQEQYNFDTSGLGGSPLPAAGLLQTPNGSSSRQQQQHQTAWGDHRTSSSSSSSSGSSSSSSSSSSGSSSSSDGSQHSKINWNDQTNVDVNAPYYHRITWGKPNTRSAHFAKDTAPNVTAVVGQKAELPCKVFNLGKKDVSWIRQRDLHILTVGIFTYTSDDRFKVFHPEGSDVWNLVVNPVTFRDTGVYECQVSTSPKIFLPVLLNVDVQRAIIIGRKEVHIQKGSTVRLTCIVKTHLEDTGTVTWYRDTTELDYDSPRGGVSIEIEKTPLKTTSKLFLTRAEKADSGNYTCAPQFADAASVLVHVVTGEESAAVHTANVAKGETTSDTVLMMCSLIFLLCHAAR